MSKRSHHQIAKRRYVVHCPHCQARACARTSLRISDEARTLHLICSNDDCACEFSAIVEERVTITHLIRPSLRPTAGVALLQAPLRPRRPEPAPVVALPAPELPTPANDCGPEVPPAANDDDVLSEATG